MDANAPREPRSRQPLLLRAEDFLAGKPPAVVFLFGVLFTCVVAILDHLVGPRTSLQLFYVMPVGLVTWNIGRRTGAAMVVVATAAGLAAEVMGHSRTDLVPYWNAGVRFLLLLLLAMLLRTFRDSIDQQRRRAEAERGVSNSLRELNEMKNTLLHAVSHDLKGPLAAILGSISTLGRAEQLQLTRDQRDELYRAIDVSGRKMDRLVNDLLDMDRIDRGDLQPTREPTDVGDLAKRVMRECEQLGPHPVRVEADPILVDVDRLMVERIIENLLVNAARHTPVATPVHIGVRGRADSVIITVEDEGPGIPEELKGALFEPFRQGPSASGQGVGIGLSLVRRFAELHEGSARVEDAPGGGARFVIILPGKVTAKEVVGTRDARLRAV